MRTIRIGARGIQAFRFAALLWSGLLSLLFLSGLPIYDRYLEGCAGTSCPGASIEMLSSSLRDSWGLTPSGLAALYAGFDLVCFLIYAGAAGVLLRKRSREPVPLVGCVLLISYAFITMYPDSLLHASAWEAVRPIYRLADAAAFLSVFLFGLLFPGSGVPRRWMSVAGWLVFVPRFLSTAAPPSWPLSVWPSWLTGLWMVAFYGLLLFVQIYRYRFAADTKQQEQTRLFVLGFSIMILGVGAVNLLPLAGNPDFYESRDPAGMLLVEAASRLLFLLLPLTLVVSVQRYRLWNIEPIVNRTILYAALSGSLAVLYVGTVWYLGTVFGTGNQAAVSLAATGLIAVLFAPLKERIQNGLNRLLYGEKEDPFAVLLRLGHRLKEPHRPEDAMLLVVKTVRDTLKLPYVSLKLSRNGGFAEVAEAGSKPADEDRFEELPLVVNGEELGILTVSRSPSGEPFPGQDRRMLELLARQAGVVVAGAKQMLDIRLLAQELQQSRERIILAREEERLAIRRNLHDDLAPRLAALALNADSAEEWMKRDTERAGALVSGLKTVIRQTVEDIRGLVYELRPPALDELGLLEAVKQKRDELRAIASSLPEVSKGSGGRLAIEIVEPHDPLPPLPAAVEVAAYRILVEAMLNCVKHSRATRCEIRVAMENEGLRLSVADNGAGFAPGAAGASNGSQVRGIGLASMRERAAELGGSWALSSSPGNGTSIDAWLPCNNYSREEH